MKIAFPLASESELAIDFARSNFVGIYDVNDGNLDFISLASQSFTSIPSFIFETMKQLETKWVVSPFFSFMALRVFKENNFNTLKATGTNLLENINYFKTGMLEPFCSVDVFLAMQNCKDGCSSCASPCLTK